MFYKYLLVSEDNNSILYLYVNNINSFLELNSTYDLYIKTINYIDRLNIKFDGDKVVFVKDDIAFFDILLSDFNGKKENIEIINKFIDLDNSNGINEKLKLNEYIFGVVSSEMPAIFNEETLKAQAVIARTYALKRLSRRLPIKNFNSTQIFRDKSYLKQLWQDNYDSYSNKIINAINDTNDEVIKFDGDYIDCYYHLSSGDKTEDSVNVLKLAYPYLVSVDNSFEKNSTMVSRRIIPNDYLSKLLNIDINKNLDTKIIMKTIGHRVKYVKIGDKVFDGLILSNRLGLNSNDFTIDIEDNYTTFTTRGHGHGLGLSKYGAEQLAKSGYNYRQIIAHYYPNTYIEKNIY